MAMVVDLILLAIVTAREGKIDTFDIFSIMQPQQQAPAPALGHRGSKGHSDLRKTKKPRLDNPNITYEEILQTWTQCCYLMTKKQRLCNIARAPNSLYCGNHMQSMCKDTAISESDQRIPCPIDPSHTIYLRNRDAHIKICNAGKHQQVLESLPYFCQNCNSGLSSETTTEEEADPALLLQKINSAFEEVVIDLLEKEDENKDSTTVDTRIRTALCGEQSAFNRLRHVEQDIAIVNKLMQYHLLDDNTTLSPKTIPSTYIEFGAGKGLLTQSIHLCDRSASFLLIERSGNRRKIDRFLQEEQCKIQRLRMDIRDCYLPKVPDFLPSEHADSRRVVAVAKHLCGVASDLSIRAMSHLEASSNLNRGLAIATCCHHCCQYDDYAGKDWLKRWSITSKEFELLRKWSGWAHLDRTISSRRKPKELKDDNKNEQVIEDKHDDIDEEHNSDNAVSVRPTCLSEEEMPIIGKKVKRILDYGRVLYLRNTLNMKVKYVQYCDATLSPECMLILASDV
jgi:tRNA:m4X modification enzyme